MDISSIWNSEGSNYNPDRHREAFYREAINGFLEAGNQSQIEILVGPKGAGKTMLLRQKAYEHIQRADGVLSLSAGNNLIENVTHTGLLANSEVTKFLGYDVWRSVWTFCIYVTVLRHLKVELPGTLREQLGDSRRLSRILEIVTQYRSNLELFSKYNTPLASLINHHVSNGVLLCIDNIDGAFTDLLKNVSTHSYRQGKLPDAVRLWMDCQNGAVAAAYSINIHEDHLKVMVTVRSEAIAQMEDPHRQNYMGRALRLRLDPYHLKKMFEQKIRLMDDAYVVMPASNKPFERFVGFNQMTHPYAGIGNSEPQKESVYKFIHRHTFGRPREFSVIGLEISRLVMSENYLSMSYTEREKILRYEVHRVAGELFEVYAREIIPPFSTERLDDFLSHIRCNVFSKEQVSEEFYEDMTYYYNLGLIGYVSLVIGTEDNYVQEFRPVTAHGYASQHKLPKSDYYLTHPCLDGRFQDLFPTESYYNRYNIIGSKLEFILPPDDELTDQDWIPAQVTGGRKAKPHERHVLPLLDYYRAIRKDGYLQRRKMLKEFTNIFYRRMKLIHRLIAYKRCQASQADERWNEHIRDYELEIQRSGLCCMHTARLGYISQVVILTFYERLQARLVAVALALFYPHLRLADIRSLIADGKYDESSQHRGKKHENYLRNAFYISNLTKVISSPYNQAYRKELIEGLSQVERNALKGLCQHLLLDLSTMPGLPPDQSRYWSDHYAGIELF